MKFIFYYFALLLLFSSCQTGPAPEVESEEMVTTPLDETFVAHGSIDSWNQFRTLSFTYISERNDKRDTQHITTDLRDRRELIKTSSADVGFDGSEYWKVMHDSSAANSNATFMVNLQFYFFAMPFVLADPGVRMQPLTPQMIAGKTYNVTKITFGDSVGVAPEDEYILYTDPATKKLEYLLYSVTYFDVDRAGQYNALHYEDWQMVDGLLVPKVLQRYAWDAEAQALGEARGTKYFWDVQFSKMTQETAFYQKP